MSASQVSMPWASIGASDASRSSGANRVHVREMNVESSNVSRQQRVRVALGHDADDLVDQRTARRRAADDDLPARLDTDAGVDEELGELAITWVSHGATI